MKRVHHLRRSVNMDCRLQGKEKMVLSGVLEAIDYLGGSTERSLDDYFMRESINVL